MDFRMDKLNFITAGIPRSAKGYPQAFEVLRNMELDGIELEFVHGVRMSPASQEFVKNNKDGLVVTSHSPYYINLNAREEEKVQASINYVLQTARMTNIVGGYSVVYHAGFYLGQEKDKVFNKILEGNKIIMETLEKEGINIWVRPETTGKGTQWGDLDEIIEMSLHFKNMLPCVDFAHLHARSGGKYNTYKDFCEVFEKVGKKLGENALKNFHAHIAGIAYSDKGEKHHLILKESDFNYKELLKAFKEYSVCGVVTCESPNIEEDCKLLKEYYLSLN